MTQINQRLRTALYDCGIGTAEHAPPTVGIRKIMEDKMNKRRLLLSMTLLAAMAWANLPSSPAYGDEPLVVTAKIHVTPGREAEYEAGLIKFTEFVRKTEVGVTFRAFHSNSDRTLYSTFEVYPNSKAFSNHLNVTFPAYAREVGPEPQGLYSRPMDVEFWQELAVEVREPGR